MNDYPCSGFVGLPFPTLISKVGSFSQGAQVTSRVRAGRLSFTGGLPDRRASGPAKGRRQECPSNHGSPEIWESYLENFYRRTQSVGLPSLPACTDTTKRWPSLITAKKEYAPPTGRRYGFPHLEPGIQRKSISFLESLKGCWNKNWKKQRTLFPAGEVYIYLNCYNIIQNKQTVKTTN